MKLNSCFVCFLVVKELNNYKERRRQNHKVNEKPMSDFKPIRDYKFLIKGGLTFY